MRKFLGGGQGLVVTLPETLSRAVRVAVALRTARLYGWEAALLLVAASLLAVWLPLVVPALLVLALLAVLTGKPGAAVWPLASAAALYVVRHAGVPHGPLILTGLVVAVLWVVAAQSLVRRRARRVRGLPEVRTTPTLGDAGRAARALTIPGRIVAAVRSVGQALRMLGDLPADPVRFALRDVPTHLGHMLAYRHRVRAYVFGFISVGWIGEGWFLRGALPIVVGERETSSTRTLHVRVPRHASVEHLTRGGYALNDLAAAWKIRPDGVSAVPDPANAQYAIVHLTVRDVFQASAAGQAAAFSAPAWPGLDRQASTSLRDPIPLGYGEQGEPAEASWSDLGGELAAGSPGAGKSTWLHTQILWALLDPRATVLLVDGKHGAEFDLYRDIPGVIVVDSDQPDAVIDALGWWNDAVIGGTYQEMKLRRRRDADAGTAHGKSYANVWKDDPLADMPVNLLVVDEFSTFTTSGGKLKNAFNAVMTRATKDGRGAAAYSILATQQPTVDMLVSGIRSNLVPRRIFACVSIEQTVAASGSAGHPAQGIDASTIPIDDAHRGVFLNYVAGEAPRLRSYWLSPAERAQAIDRARELRAGRAYPDWPGDPQGPGRYAHIATLLDPDGNVVVPFPRPTTDQPTSAHDDDGEHDGAVYPEEP